MTPIKGAALRVLRSVLYKRVTEAFACLGWSLLIAGIAWVFIRVLANDQFDFMAVLRIVYLVSYGISTLLALLQLLLVAIAAHHVQARYTEVWDAVTIYKLPKSAYKSPEAFQSAMDLRRAIRGVLGDILEGTRF